MADWGRNLLGGLRPEQARGPLLGGHDLEGSGEVLNRDTDPNHLYQAKVCTMEYINPVLVLILVSEICLGICTWNSPRVLRRVAAHLLTRADVVDIFRQENIRRMQFWTDKFGLEADSVRAKHHAVLPIFPD